MFSDASTRVGPRGPPVHSLNRLPSAAAAADERRRSHGAQSQPQRTQEGLCDAVAQVAEIHLLKGASFS